MSARPHFRFAGIPIRIEPLFWVVAALFGLQYGDDVGIVLTWVAAVLVSLLVHELGHALALKAFGEPSSIVIHGFGGLTQSRRRLSRLRSITVTLAGPLSAIVLLGLPARWLRDSDQGLDLRMDYDGGFGLWPLVVFSAFINIWWSLLNLLPIRPLDGGNVMTDLVGLRPARILSIGFGIGAAVWAYSQDQQYATFLLGFLAFINLSELRRAEQGVRAPSTFDIQGPEPAGGRGPRLRSVPPAPGPGAAPPPRLPSSPPLAGPPSAQPVVPTAFDAANRLDPDAAESLAWNALRRDDGYGAMRVLGRAGGPVNPFATATAALATGAGIDALVAAYLADPSGPSNLVPASVAAQHGQALPLAQALVSAGGSGLGACAVLQTHLHYAEHFEHAAAVGELLFAAGPPSPAQTAFDTACAWSRAGDGARAVAWIGRAVQSGFRAPSLLDGEPDLTTARQAPGWAEVRATVG